MSYFKEREGFGLIIAVVTLLVFSLTSVVVVSLVSTDSDIALYQLQSTDTGYIARAGMEKALYLYKNSTLCGSISSSFPNTLGSGSTSVTGTLFTPSPSATLSAGIDNLVTTIPVNSTTPTGCTIPPTFTYCYAPHGRIKIDSEELDYTDITSNSFTGAKRGVNGTSAASHLSAASVSQNQCLIKSTGTNTATGLGTAQRVFEAGPTPLPSSSSNNAMMVYAKANSDGKPYYRLWDGSAWGAENPATDNSGATIHFLVLKFARTRNEAVLGTQYSSGDIKVQVWNGTTWSATTQLANHSAGTPRRGFDIAYETSSDRAMVVYRNANNTFPEYRIWDGNSWSAAQTINIVQTSAQPRWIVMASNPLSSSNEIALMNKTETQITGLRWTGSAWDNMGDSTVWDGNPLDLRFHPQVAYEQQSGRAMFIWGAASGSLDYSELFRIWDGSTLTAKPTLNPCNQATGCLRYAGVAGTGCPSGCARARFIRLVAQPNSNNLMNGIQDENRKLLTVFWNGSSWNSSILQDSVGTKTSADRNYDLVFETHSSNAGKAWLVWADAATVSRMQWSGSSWGSATTVGDDTCLVQLLAQPTSGAVFAAMYQDTSSATDDIQEMDLTNGSSTWSSLFTVWSGATVSCDIMTKVEMAPQRYSASGAVGWIDWREAF